MLIKRKSQQSSQLSPPPPPPLYFPGEEELRSEPKLIAPEKPTAAQDTVTEESKKIIHSHQKRLWTEEDEIVILKGVIDYTSEKKSDPISDPNSFHDFIKKDLHVDATKDQLVGKIRELKRKYITNNKGIRRRSFSRSHDRELHGLARLIWGSKRATVRAAAEESEAAAERGEGEELMRGMSVEERMLIVGREVYEKGEGGVEGGKEWERLRVEELEVYQKELEVKVAQSKVRIAQTQLVLDAIKRRKVKAFSS